MLDAEGYKNRRLDHILDVHSQWDGAQGSGLKGLSILPLLDVASGPTPQLRWVQGTILHFPHI